MDANGFYTVKAQKLKQLKAHLEAALAVCGQLEEHEATAAAGEDGYMFDAFATLADIHAGVADQYVAVLPLMADEQR